MKVTLVKEFGSNEIFAAFTNDDRPLFVGATHLGKDWAEWANNNALAPGDVGASLPAGMLLDGPRDMGQEIINLFNFKPMAKSVTQDAYQLWIESKLDGSSTKALFGRSRRGVGRARDVANGPDSPRVGRRRRRGDGDLGPSLRPRVAPPGMMARPDDGDGDGWTDENDISKRRYVGFIPRTDGDRPGFRWTRKPESPESEKPPRRLVNIEKPKRQRGGFVQRVRDRIGDAIDASPTPLTRSNSRMPRERVGRDGGRLTLPSIQSTADEVDQFEAKKQELLEKTRKLIGKKGKLSDDAGRKKVGMNQLQRLDEDVVELAAERVAGYNMPVEVKVGSKGIDTHEQAIDALKNGAPLSDIPDDFLAIAILANSDDRNNSNRGNSPRFEISSEGGVNATRVVKDTTNGARYGLKYTGRYDVNTGDVALSSQFLDEDVNEALGSHLAERLGMAQGQFRFSTPVGEMTMGLIGVGQDKAPGRGILFEFGQTVVDAEGLTEAKNRREAMDIQLEDTIPMQLLDYLSLNLDRHRGNYLSGGGQFGEGHYPIDMGAGFGAAYEVPDEIAQGGRGSLMGYLADVSNKYEATRWKIAERLRGLRGAQKEREKEKIASEIEPAIANLIARLKTLEDELSLEDSIDYLVLTSGRTDVWDELQETVDRYQYLLNEDPKELAKIIVNSFFS